MTQNLYLGTDLAPVIAAGNLGAMLQAVASRWAQVQQTDFPARAQRIADEIAAEKPDIIGLQECEKWSTGPFDPSHPATNVRYDFLQILLDALEERGLHYGVVATENGYDIEGTGLFTFGLMDVRLQDREVILGRTDRNLAFSNAVGHNFTHNLVVPTLIGPVPITRGYCSVDVRYHGKSFRFVTTHLEPEHPLISHLQSQELLTGPADTSLDVVYVGDLNSRADGSTAFTGFQEALAAGFYDAWSTVHPDLLGYTYGHGPDLLDDAVFYERIDYVLFRGAGVVPTSAVILGRDAANRTSSGLWPSDHAGVVATLVLK